jgi:MinD-like ATPase involved in chromosome partitioning or flagellar assembly
VVTAESPSIQTAVGTLHTLKRWVAKFKVILNQTSPGPQIPAGVIEHALKQPLVRSIPYDPAQDRALAEGVPLALQSPGSPLAQAVLELAQEQAWVTQGVMERGKS